MDILNSTGKRLRLLRGDLDLTQEELRRQLQMHGVKVSRSYLSILERSESVPSGDIVAGLARVLNTTTDYLLLLTDDAAIPGETDEDERNITDEEWSLIQNLRRLIPVDRATVIDLAGRLADFGLRVQERSGAYTIGGAQRQSAPQPAQLRGDLAALLASAPAEIFDELAAMVAANIRDLKPKS